MDIVTRHSAFLTGDMDGSIAWFQHVFGATLKRRGPGMPGLEVAFLGFGDAEIELIEDSDPARMAGKTGLQFDHVCFLVKDLEAVVAELRSKGMEFVIEPRVGSMGYKIIMSDPATCQGIKMEFSQAPGTF